MVDTSSEGATTSLNSKMVLLNVGEEMADITLTRLSSKGQIVIPQKLRKALRLREGEVFVMTGRRDTIVLKRLRTPSDREFEALLEWGERFARKKGLRPRDVRDAMDEERKESNEARP